jgi:hypothetical protein
VIELDPVFFKLDPQAFTINPANPETTKRKKRCRRIFSGKHMGRVILMMRSPVGMKEMTGCCYGTETGLFDFTLKSRGTMRSPLNARAE